MALFLDGPLCEEQWGWHIEAPCPRGTWALSVNFPYVPDPHPGGSFYKHANYRWGGYGWLHNAGTE